MAFLDIKDQVLLDDSEVSKYVVTEIAAEELADVEWFPGDGNVCKTSWK
jgi:hypothetical protein